MKSANLAVRLFLELAALAALGYWGWVTADGAVARLAQAVAAPVLFALAWGLFISPKAPRRLADPVRLIAEIALFGLAAGALAAAGRSTAAVLFAITVGAHLALMVRWSQRGM
ncbi:MAG TPA: YrdB family protein [Egibacteraceae bacterium]|nr:YrdB family protein [Egibacteraceae bacterium]